MLKHVLYNILVDVWSSGCVVEITFLHPSSDVEAKCVALNGYL
jgi:hypothetical protein